jgi:hypothetical protein
MPLFLRIIFMTLSSDLFREHPHERARNEKFCKLKLISDGAEYIASHYTDRSSRGTREKRKKIRKIFQRDREKWLITFFTIFRYILCTRWGAFMLKRVARLLFHFESIKFFLFGRVWDVMVTTRLRKGNEKDFFIVFD